MFRLNLVDILRVLACFPLSIVQVLESCEDYELIDLCLNGFKKAVRIAGGLDVSVRASLVVVGEQIDQGKHLKRTRP